jgi:hypothetical protein
LRVGAHGFGLLQSARGLGAVIGSSLYRRRPETTRDAYFSFQRYFTALFRALGVAPSFTLALILMSCVGITDTIWGASRHHHAVDHTQFRGRVMGVFH